MIFVHYSKHKIQEYSLEMIQFFPFDLIECMKNPKNTFIEIPIFEGVQERNSMGTTMLFDLLKKKMKPFPREKIIFLIDSSLPIQDVLIGFQCFSQWKRGEFYLVAHEKLSVLTIPILSFEEVKIPQIRFSMSEFSCFVLLIHYRFLTKSQLISLLKLYNLPMFSGQKWLEMTKKKWVQAISKKGFKEDYYYILTTSGKERLFSLVLQANEHELSFLPNIENQIEKLPNKRKYQCMILTKSLEFYFENIHWKVGNPAEGVSFLLKVTPKFFGTALTKHNILMNESVIYHLKNQKNHGLNMFVALPRLKYIRKVDKLSERQKERYFNSFHVQPDGKMIEFDEISQSFSIHSFVEFETYTQHYNMILDKILREIDLNQSFLFLYIDENATRNFVNKLQNEPILHSRMERFKFEFIPKNILDFENGYCLDTPQ